MKPDNGATFAVALARGEVIGEHDGPAARRARKADSAWFAKRPHRTIRFRDPLPGELAESRGANAPPPEVQGSPARMVVVQIRPGVRTRRLVYTHLKHAPEAVLRAFMEVYGAAQDQGYAGEISKDDVLASLGRAKATRH